MRIDIEKGLLLIAGFIISIFIICILSGCKKNDPEPVSHIEIPNTTITEVKASTMSIVTINGRPRLYINDIEQINLEETFIVNTGDKVRVIDNGFDTTRIIDGNVYPQEGRVTLQIIVNNNIVYEESCNCDVDKTIEI